MKPLPVSFSALDKFETCPKQYHEVKVVKSVSDSKGDAALWGDHVHANFEKYIEAKGSFELPVNLEMYREYLDRILALKGEIFAEVELAVDTKLQRCEFFASNVFIRGYADVLRLLDNRAWVLDHKTGARKPDSYQMKLMALLVFLLYPQVDEVSVGFAWLKVKKFDGDRFTKTDIPDLWQVFLPKIRRFRDAFTANTWPPRQSGLCHGWCPVKTCEFWKPKRLKK